MPFAFSETVAAQIVTPGFSWTPLGPSGISARVNAVVVDPRSSTTLLLAAPGGGVWRSQDSGATWAPLSDTAATLQTCALSVDPNNPDHLFAGTGDDRSPRPSMGVLRSTDGGNTWNVSPGFSSQPVCAVAVDPRDGTRVLAGSLSGIFRSTDGGVNWKRVSGLAAQSLLFDPAANGVVYAGMFLPNFLLGTATPSPLQRSTDGGAAWSDAPLPPADPTNPRTFQRAAVATGAPGTLYFALSYAKANLKSVDLYLSTDGGTTWAVFPTVASGGGRLALLFDTVNQVLYLGAASLTRFSPDLQSSTPLTTATSNINALAFFSGSVLAASDLGLNLVPTDGSASTSLSLPALGQFISVNSDPVSTTTTYAGSDEGLRILQPSSGLWNRAVTVPVGSVQAVATSPENVYALANANVYRSTDGGSTFKTSVAIPALEPRAPFPPLVVDSLNPLLLFTAGQRLYRSADGGQTWTAISGPLVANSSDVVMALAQSPSNRQVMYAAAACLPELVPAGTNCPTTSRVFRSINSGVTWQQVSTLIGLVNQLQVDPNVVFLVYAAIGAFPSGPSAVAGLLPGDLLRSRDGGTTWESILTNLPHVPINAVAIDPQSPAGAFQPATRVFVGTDAGVFVTQNANLITGAQWVAINSGLPNVPISNLKLRRPDGTLRAATFGRGIYRGTGITNISSSLILNPLGTTLSLVQGQSGIVSLQLICTCSSGLDWAATVNDPWLSASTTGGHLGPNATTMVNLTINTTGLAVGNYRTRVRVSQLPTATARQFDQDFVLNVLVSTPPSRLVVVSGDGVTANAGSNVTLMLQALDADGNPLGGLPVEFRITSGGGQISPPSGVTDAQGRAGSLFTLPRSAGTVKVTATVVGLSATFTITVVRLPAPALNSGAAVNAASFAAGGSLAPGAIVAIFGTDLATSSANATDVPLPLGLGGTTVTIGGLAAPLFFVSPAQVNAQVPYELSAGTSTLQVKVDSPAGAVTSNSIEVNIAPAAPGIFTLNSDGHTGLFQKTTDFSLVNLQNPARRGDVVVFYATGLGAVRPPVASGSGASTNPLSQTVVTPNVSVGGVDARVLFSGLTPGAVGLYQINILIPATVSPASNVSVNLRIGTAVSNTVTLPVI